jgi:nucleotide-binding universal stress UspA family protein
MKGDGMIAKILVPTDFSTGSGKAWKTALRLADTLGAEVILLHVLPTTPLEVEALYAEEEQFAELRARQATHQLGIPRTDEPPRHPHTFHGPLRGDVLRDFSEAGREWAAMLEKWADVGHEAGVKVRTLLRVGTPYREVVEAAKDEGADLVLLATHGWGEIHRLLVGSVADKVIRMAPCPVMTVREAA